MAITSWHHIDDQDDTAVANAHDLLETKGIAGQELSSLFEIKLKPIAALYERKFGNLKEDLYRDIIIMLAREGFVTREVANILGVPRRTLTDQINKLF